MHRVGRWFDRGKVAVGASTGLDAEREAQNMEIALKAAELIMDDDIEGAEENLRLGDSAFHKLARGTLAFMKATLGFEQEAMKEATDLLYDAESSAAAFYGKAHYDPSAFTSTIYDRGAEFALCQAEAQIMSAVVGVLNESLTESIKGFYKLRKGYLTLNELAQMEESFIKARGVRSLANSQQPSAESLASAKSGNLSRSTAPSAPRSTIITAPAEDNDDDSDEEFFEPAEDSGKTAVVNDTYKGHIESPLEINTKLTKLDVNDTLSTPASGAASPALPAGASTPIETLATPNLITADADSEIFAKPLDIFIHSGVNLMSGIINLMLSIIPPAFGRLLSIIGFRGDRERGLRMLWQATKFENINGGMAALIVFAWYNGISGFCDIISDSDPNVPDDVNGFPNERLQRLLIEMRKRYPRSFLWKLEEARSYTSSRNVDKALEILKNTEKSQLKQLEALRYFEKSLSSMNAHQYTLCAESFITCVDLNGWSKSLYYYSAGAAHLQLYRDLEDSEDSAEQAQAIKNKELAEEYFKASPAYVGKKKMMGRQLPFDTFVLRKVAKWEARAAARKCSFLEAIVVAPLEEIALLWNGYKKMNETQLRKSLANLAWSERQPTWQQEDIDERASHAVLRASVLRNLRHHEKAKQVLRDSVLQHTSASFKGSHHEGWPGPVAQYEMACNLWMQRSEYRLRHGTTVTAEAVVDDDTPEKVTQIDVQADAKLVREAKGYLERAKNWGSYELDTRIGMKITAGLTAVNRWESKHGLT